MSDAVVFKSPYIQEALPELNALATKAREACNERKLAFVIIVHDQEAVDSYIASNIPQEQALQLLALSAYGHGHGPPKTIK